MWTDRAWCVVLVTLGMAACGDEAHVVGMGTSDGMANDAEAGPAIADAAISADDAAVDDAGQDAEPAEPDFESYPFLVGEDECPPPETSMPTDIGKPCAAQHDCSSDEACDCHYLLCFPAACHSADDCGGRNCARAMDGCGHHGFFCATPNDQCVAGSEYCIFNEVVGYWQYGSNC